MKYILSLVVIAISTNAYCLSITDKLLYDNYEDCVSHKLAGIDIRKTTIYIAKQAIEQDCKKSFCSNKIPRTNEEYENCVQERVELCNSFNLYRKNNYEKHQAVLRRKTQCLEVLNAKNNVYSTYTNEFLCSDPYNPENKDIDHSKMPSYESCEESNYYEYCKKSKFADNTCR